MVLLNSTPTIPTLASLLPDVVCVFDQDYVQLFKEARPMEVYVNEDAKTMEHPLESGAVTTDHIIWSPISIDMTLIIPLIADYNVFQRIRSIFLDGEILIIQTKAQVYRNMIIKSMPHAEKPDMFYSLGMPIKFQEVQFAPEPVSSVIPRAEPKKSTVRRGEIFGPPRPSEPSQSFIDNVFFGAPSP